MSDESHERHRTFVYRLKPTKAQERGLERYLAVTRAVYNAGLEQRITAWEGRHQRSCVQQRREIKELRRAGLLEGCHVHAVQGALNRLDRAYAAFFARCASNAHRKGFPRFKGERHWRSIYFQEYGSGCVIRDGRLRVTGVGSIRIRQHRELVGEPKTATLVRKADGWHVHIVCVVPSELVSGPCGSLDLGVNYLATLHTGERVLHPRKLRSASSKLRAEQRTLARKQPGSRRRDKQRQRLALAHLHVARARRDYLHKQARILADRFQFIAVEGLAVTAMTRKGGRAKAGLNRAILDASWSEFLSLLASKLEERGGGLVRVDPRGTSQECSGCGGIVPKGRGEREHRCGCGTVLDRDHNAALNIYNRAWAAPVAEAA